MGSGASQYSNVAQALDDGHTQGKIEAHLTSLCAPEIAAINRAFGTSTDAPATAAACGRAAQRALEGLGFDLRHVVYANSTSRDEFAREHHWWSYLEGTATDAVLETPALKFDVGGLGGFLAAGKTGLELIASHALEQVGNVFLVFGPHIGVDADGTLGFAVHPGSSEPVPCSAAALQALEWAQDHKGPFKPDPDDQQMDRLRQVAMKLVDGTPAPPPVAVAEGAEPAAEEAAVVEDEPTDPNVAMAEALYASTYEQVMALVPKHLAHDRPVILCGGISVITGPGKPDFFACKSFQVYSPREPEQPNDAFASYRASLRSLLA